MAKKQAGKPGGWRYSATKWVGNQLDTVEIADWEKSLIKAFLIKVDMKTTEHIAGGDNRPHNKEERELAAYFG